MKAIVYLLSILSLSLVSQTQVFQWVKGFGGSGFDHGYAITTDPSGNIYLVGNFSDTCDFDPGPGVYTLTAASSQMFVAKYSSTGSLWWSRQIVSVDGYTRARDVSCISGILKITGIFSGTADFDPGAGNYTLTSVTTNTGTGNDCFLLQLDTAGYFISVNNIGVPDDYEIECCIAVNNSGAGFTAQTSGPSTNQETIIIRDLDGTPTSTISPVTSTDNITFGGIATDNTGNRIVSGSFRGKAAFATNTLTSFGGTYDIFIAMFSPTGSLVWVKKIGSNFDDTGAKVASDGLNIYATGYYGGTVDFDPGPASYSLSTLTNDAFLLKLNGNGNFLLARSLQSDPGSVSYGYGIETDAQGNIYLNGSFYGSVDLDPSPIQNVYTNYDAAFFVSKYNSSGNLLWNQLAVSPFSLYCVDVAADSNNGIYTTGWFSGMADFNNSSVSQTITTSSNTDRDVFILKLNNIIGIKEFEKENNVFGFYPNPCNDLVFVEGIEEGKISLLTVTGQELIARDISIGSKISLDLKNFSAGIYLLMFKNKETGEITAEHFIRQN
jgi:hypothetical protein